MTAGSACAPGLAIDRVAEEILAEIATSDEHAALRTVADFIVRLQRTDLDSRSAMLAPTPPAIGRQQWDALVASVAEMLANQAGLVPPRWAMTPSRFLTTWWFVSPYRSLHASALVDAPAELANRGVFLHRSSLESV